VAQRVGRGIALLFHDRGTRRGEWSAAAGPGRTLPPGKTRYPFYRRLGWAGPVWTGGKSRPHRDSIPDRPARSQSLYRLSCPVRVYIYTHTYTHTHTHTHTHRIIILPIVLYGCETSSLRLKEEYRLRIFENRAQRNFGRKGEEITDDWRKRHNEELHDHQSSPIIVKCKAFP